MNVFCKGAITITAVIVTASTCPNNGTATIHASSNSATASLYYALGPIYSPWQNDSVFQSLFPGNYSARVYDLNSFDSTQVSFTISGNYELPVYYPVTTAPLCDGLNNGSIIGHADSAKGRLPFLWEIISPVQIGPQAGDVFNSLPADTYTVRMMDACSNIQTKVIDLTNTGTGLTMALSDPILKMIGCNILQVKLEIDLDTIQAHYPLKLHVDTGSGFYIKTVYAIPANGGPYSNPALYLITDTVYNVTYGDYLQICISDTCNLQVCGTHHTIPPFDFNLGFSLSNTNCTSNYSGSVSPFYPWNSIYAQPVHLIVMDIAANSIVQNQTFNDIISGVHLTSQVAGQLYRITITDTCGHVFQKDTLWPLPPVMTAAYVYVQPPLQSCYDSTAGAQISCYNFTSSLKFELLSGPSIARSTKLHFAYRDTIIYPFVIDSIANIGSFYVQGLPRGNYTYRVSDSCGHVYLGSFTISFVYSYTYRSYFKRGCGGINKAYFEYGFNGNIFTGDVHGLYQLSYNGTYLPLIRSTSVYPWYWYNSNIPPGSYSVSVGFLGTGSYFIIGNSNCWNFRDTLVIPPVSNNLIKSNTTIFCHGQIYLDVQSDSSNGVPPFQYEIINGPQIFPLQSSGLFHLSSVGTYLARVIDSCGNSNVVQATVDTTKVDSIFRTGSICTGNTVKLSAITSPYFTHVWIRPAGTAYIGDTLTIYPFSMADTGNYIIKKVVHINGCTDTFSTVYHLNDRDDIVLRHDTICAGTALHIGGHSYIMAGTYLDTLLSQAGCDSLVFTELVVKNEPPITIIADTLIICASNTANICAAPGYANYQWNNGFTGSCISASLAGNYYVTVTDHNGCTAGSNYLYVSVIPLPPVAISVNGDTLSAYNAVTYQWLFNGDTIPGATDETFIALQNGNYQVAVTDTNGCGATSNIIAINTNGINVATGNEVWIGIYPNPAKRFVTITTSRNLLGGFVSITDITGRLIVSISLKACMTTISTQNLSAGLYFVTVAKGNNYNVSKLVVE